MSSQFSILDDLSTGVQIIDPEMRYVFLNQELLSQVKMSAEQMVSLRMEEVYPGIQDSEIYRVIQSVIESGEARSLINEFVFPDGRMNYYRLEVQKIPQGAIVFSWDVTSEKETEALLGNAALRWKEEASKHQETLRKILDASLDGVQYFRSIRDDSGKIVDFEYVISNRVACEIIGRAESEVLGKRLLELIPGHLDIVKEYGRSLFDLYCEVVETGENKSLLFHFEANGIDGWFSNKSVKLGDGFVVNFSVVTELVNKTTELERLNNSLQEEVRKEIEKNRRKDETLIRQSKLAAMGDMLSAIAHQWRQPLHAVLLGIELSREIVEKSWQSIPDGDKSELEEIYAIIEDRIKYLSDTIEDFRDFYGPSQKVEDFSLEEALEASLRFFEGQLRSRGIICTLDGDLEGCTLHGNANQFRQVLLSLIGNSIDAFSKKIITDQWIRITAKKEGSAGLVLSLEDNAGGIKAEVLPRVFEPYFTTKGPSGGTGIGLYIARLIMEKSFQGQIEAVPTESGIRFIMRFPLHG
ncbi:MAG: ATP-binding protein [Leptospiraceae bacterium]